MAASSVGPHTSAMAKPASLTTKWNTEKANWLKVGHGLLHLRDLLIPETIRVMKQFHANIITGVVVAACPCTAENLKKKTKNPPCKTCRQLLPKINAAGTDPKTQLIWSNTNPTRWLEDWWEVAKCFLGSGQTADNHGPEDTDSANIFTLWINCSEFATLCTSTVLEKARETRNTVAHEPDMKCSDEKLQDYFNNMLNVVNDPRLCAHIGKASEAMVAELEEIRDEEFAMVPNEEAKVLKDLGKLTSVIALVDAQPGFLEGLPTRVPELEKQMLVGERKMSAIENTVKDHRETMNAIQDSQEDQGKALGDLKQEMSKLEFMVDVSDKTPDYMGILVELQHELCDTYQRRCCNVYPAPWLPEYLPLEDIFQEVALKDGRRKLGDEQIQERKFGLNDLFRPAMQGKPWLKRVLIEGAPGIGKTTLCQRLLLQLSSIESPPVTDIANGQAPEGLNSPSSHLPRFGAVLFLSVVDLRPGDLIGSLLETLLQEKWLIRRKSLQRCLQDICQQLLFILDGYDEGNTDQRKHADRLLDGQEMKGSTILVTSRPGFRALTPPPDMTYRLEGFDESKQKDFIMCFDRVTGGDFSEETASVLLARFRGQGFMQFPLLLTLTCFLARQGQDVLPATVTGLYQQFVQVMCDKAVKSLTFQEVYVSKLLLWLQKIAFEHLRINNSEIAHTLSNYVPKSQVKNTLSDLCKLGLMCQGITLKGLKNYQSVTFIHQSFLDYFSALQFVSLDAEKRSKFLAYVDIYHNVFLFVTGLCEIEGHFECFSDMLAVWKREVEDKVEVPDFDESRSLQADVKSMYVQTRYHHSLLHLPLWWLNGLDDQEWLSSDTVAAIMQTIKCIHLTYECTVACARGMIFLCKASCSLSSDACLRLAMFKRLKIDMSVQLDIIEHASRSSSRVRCVHLRLPRLMPRECERLADLLPRLTHLARLVIDIPAWDTMELLSLGFTDSLPLRSLSVHLRPNSRSPVSPDWVPSDGILDKLSCLGELREVKLVDNGSTLKVDNRRYIKRILNERLPDVELSIED